MLPAMPSPSSILLGARVMITFQYQPALVGRSIPFLADIVLLATLVEGDLEVDNINARNTSVRAPALFHDPPLIASSISLTSRQFEIENSR